MPHNSGVNDSRYLLRWVVWIGILANWSFAAWAFVDPGKLVETLGLGPFGGTIWLFNYSVLLVILGCFYIPAARDPIRYQTSAWLMIAARLVPATTFFVGVLVGFMPTGLLKLGAGDAAFGTAIWILLTLVRRHDGLARYPARGR